MSVTTLTMTTPAAPPTRGWNWGDTKVQGKNMEFHIDNRKGFDIPFTSIESVTMANKTDVTVSLKNQPTVDGGIVVSGIRFFVSPELEVDPDVVDTEVRTASQALRSLFLSHSSLGKSGGAPFFALSALNTLIPRGRSRFAFYTSYCHFISSSSFSKIGYDMIKGLFILENEDEMEKYHVISLNSPLKKGSTQYFQLVFRQLKSARTAFGEFKFLGKYTPLKPQFENLLSEYGSSAVLEGDDEEDGSDDESTDNTEKNSSKTQPENSSESSERNLVRGQPLELLLETLSVMTQKSIKDPSIPLGSGKRQRSSLACVTGNRMGNLFCCKDFLCFLPQPSFSIDNSKIALVIFHNVSTTSSSGRSGRKTFEMTLRFKGSRKDMAFNSLETYYFSSLLDYFTERKIKVHKLASVKESAGLAFGDDEDDDGDEEEPEDDEYKASGSDSESGSSSDSDDTDYSGSDNDNEDGSGSGSGSGSEEEEEDDNSDDDDVSARKKRPQPDSSVAQPLPKKSKS